MKLGMLLATLQRDTCSCRCRRISPAMFNTWPCRRFCAAQQAFHYYTYTLQW